ncbi:MAG: hypothetical protein MUP41_07880 [Desulfobacterales bacterium]|nr:hypothetical protein [Desulfobacterales bacterium]
MARYLMFLLVAVCLIISCATMTSGKKFDTSKVSLIQKGVTTQAEILKWFGNPNEKGFKEGKEVWGYSHVSVGYFGGSSTKSLQIVFDENKVVSDYSYNEGKY